MNREPFVTGEIYHIYNRGTDKRDIFLDDNDRRRFIRSLIFFNNKNAVDLRVLNESNTTKVAPPEPDEKLVSILAYCLMPNHYHLVVQEVEENGITRFMRKLGTGYTMYFNTRNERSGVLYQGQFKSVLIDRDPYLQYIPHYIHLNPLDLVMKWREGEADYKKAKSFLNSYRWSSYHHYLNTGLDPVLDKDLISDIYELGTYKDNLMDWLQSGSVEDVKDIALE